MGLPDPAVPCDCQELAQDQWAEPPLCCCNCSRHLWTAVNIIYIYISGGQWGWWSCRRPRESRKSGRCQHTTYKFLTLWNDSHCPGAKCRTLLIISILGTFSSIFQGRRGKAGPRGLRGKKGLKVSTVFCLLESLQDSSQTFCWERIAIVKNLIRKVLMPSWCPVMCTWIFRVKPLRRHQDIIFRVIGVLEELQQNIEQDILQRSKTKDKNWTNLILSIHSINAQQEKLVKEHLLMFLFL